MTQYEQLRRFLEDMIDSLLDAQQLVEEDSTRARRLLLAIDRDLRTLEALLEALRPR